jgi:hypothetical protein
MARLIGAGDATRILAERTAPPWRTRMRQFLRRYGGQTVVIEKMTPGDDATADQALAVKCPRGDVQQALSWAWFDGAWRAWPDFALTATGQPVEYPGCR